MTTIYCYGLLIVYWMLHLIKMISNYHNETTYNIIPQGKSKQVYIEWMLKIGLGVLTIYQFFILITTTIPFTNTDSIWMVLGAIGNLGFAISMITMKSNWHASIKENKNDQLVTNGIYRYSRNPAFVSLDLLYIAIAMLIHTFGLYVLTAVVIWFIHLQIMQEEVFLKKMFGDSYIEYCKKTRRYF